MKVGVLTHQSLTCVSQTGTIRGPSPPARRPSMCPKIRSARSARDDNAVFHIEEKKLRVPWPNWAMVRYRASRPAPFLLTAAFYFDRRLIDRLLSTAPPRTSTHLPG